MSDNSLETNQRPSFERFDPPKRILLGPGPSPVDDRVLNAMTAPVLGHRPDLPAMHGRHSEHAPLRI